MKHDVVIPQLGLMEDATVQEWLHADGDRVRTGEPIVAIQTDKAAVEVESPADGVLHILVPAGPDLVSVETVLGTVDDGA